MLVRDGFRGRIYTTLPTAELSRILLLDSAHIQEMEAEWATRKHRRRGLKDVAPLYCTKDAEACLKLFQIVPFDEKISVDTEFTVCFRNAGHILGASFLEVWNGKGPQAHKTVFSGDLGQRGQLIVQDPHLVFTADTLFIESTYGNRNHKSFEESRAELLEAIRYSYDRGEKVIIPAFAVERTQELLYVIGQFFRQKLIADMPVYLDSPLAIAATEIFRRMREFLDEDAEDLFINGEDPFDFRQLVLTRTSQESADINESKGPAIVIAGNGMCTAGRIKHHLKHNIWRPGSSIVIVGFQAAGTLGRKLVEGASVVRVFGEKFAVKARVWTIGGFSAHADQTDLLEWLGHFENPRMRVYAIHGEQSISQTFAALVRERLGFETSVPAIGDVVELGPAEGAAAPEAAGPIEPIWVQQIESILQKARQIEEIATEAPGALPSHVVQGLENELAIAESHLEALLHEARKAAGHGGRERRGR